MKDFHCREAGRDCDFVFRGSSDQEILEQAGRHAQQAHNLSMSKDLEEQVRRLIHEEDSEAHRRATTAPTP